MRTTAQVFCLLLSAVALACGVPPSQNGRPGGMAADPQASGSGGLRGQVWQLERFDNQTVPLDPPITIEFDRERVTGSGGCNQYSSDVTYLQQGGLRINPAASTKKACLGGTTMSTEAAFLAALENVVRHSIEEGKLNLFYTRSGGPSGRLVFRSADGRVPG